MRILDRLREPNPSKLIAVDLRPTPVAEEADLHLAIKNGTNLVLLNTLVHEIIEGGWVDHEYVEANTIGFGELQERNREFTPEWATEICVVRAEEIREAASAIGESQRLLQTVLQGVLPVSPGYGLGVPG